MSRLTPAAPQPTGLRKHAPWIAALALTGALYWLARPHFWLAERLEDAPAWFWGVWAALAALPWLSGRAANFVLRRTVRTVRRTQEWLANRPVSGSLVLAAALTALFWLLRIQHIDLGDIYLVELSAKRGKAYYVGYAPLETLVRFWLNELLHVFPEWDFIALSKWLGCLYGAAYVLAVLWMCRPLPHPYRWFAPVFLTVTPVMQVFCGYLEVYHLPLAVQAAFLLGGLSMVFRKAPPGAVSLLFGLAMAVAAWNVVLAPGYLFLMGLALSRRDLKWTGLLFVQPVLAALPLMAALALFSFYTDPFIGIAQRFGETSRLLFNNHAAEAAGYGIWSVRHLADMANELALIALPGAALCAAAIAERPFGVLGRLASRPDAAFLGITAVTAAAFGFSYHPELGLPRDWDLFTFVFPSVTLLGVSGMKRVFFSRIWKKLTAVLVIAAAALSSAWILQNALFWNYPTWINVLGPAASLVYPDFYYTQMQRAFQTNNQHMMYWLADEALEESPGKRREILEFMNEWIIVTLGKTPPRQNDYPGWARDIAIDPGEPGRVYIFDRLGRIFANEKGILKWIYAPSRPLKSDVVGGEMDNGGTALMMTREGVLLTVDSETLEAGLGGDVQWGAPGLKGTFLPERALSRGLPVDIVDMEIRKNDGRVCVLDNYNRVWDTETRELIFQGSPSYNIAVSFHFNRHHQPVTIDVHNQLSYDPTKVRLPFKTPWFYPIVRDFILTYDDAGIHSLDLNGGVHNVGRTLMHEAVPGSEGIVDRFIKFLPERDGDGLILLDNRYRLYRAEPDVSSVSVGNKLRGLIEQGKHAQAYEHMTLFWRETGVLAETCRELADTGFIRGVRGAVMDQPYDIIPMFADAFPVDEDFLILIDRWGRLVFQMRGNAFLIEESGLTTWPNHNAVDGAMAKDKLAFLCEDGRIWRYTLPVSLQASRADYGGAPDLWLDLRDADGSAQWIGIEYIAGGDELAAMSREGVFARFDAYTGALLDKRRLPVDEPNISLFKCGAADGGLSVVYMPPSGPAHSYSFQSQTREEVPHTRFDWDAAADIVIREGYGVHVMDKFGFVHPTDSGMQFSEYRAADQADALAFRFIPFTDKAWWVRNNGAAEVLRLRR